MRARREWYIKCLTVRCTDSFNTVSACVFVCMHVCVFNTKCCQVDAPGKLLSSNPCAPGHCKTLTVSWCSQGIVWLCLCRSLYLWAVATVCHFICVYVWYSEECFKNTSHHMQGERKKNGGSSGWKKMFLWLYEVSSGDSHVFALRVCLSLSGGEKSLFFFLASLHSLDSQTISEK